MPNRFAPRHYSLWSRGRVLGHTALDYVRIWKRHRMGDLFPTEMGEKLLPVAAGAAIASIQYAKALQQLPPELLRRRGDRRADGSVLPEYIDCIAAHDELRALQLELRSPNGDLIPTNWIDVRDLEFLMSLVNWDGLLPEEPGDGELREEIEAMLADREDDFPYGTDDDDTDGPIPRYQIQVELVNEFSVP